MMESQKTAAQNPADSQTKTGATVEEVKSESVEEEKKVEAPVAENKPKPVAAPKQAATSATSASSATATSSAKPTSIMDNPLPARTDIVDKSISTYNGGSTRKYKWSQ